MIFAVEISERADSDLRAIYEYIALELLSPENASGQLDRLENSIISLEEIPERYQRYEKEPWYSRGLRIFPIDNYMICYIADTKKHIVTIIRVMYGGRDIEHQLNVHTKHGKTIEPQAALPLLFFGGCYKCPLDERKEGDTMYVTYQDLI